MNAKIRKKLSQGKRRIERRLNKNDNSGCEQPMITASNIDYQIATVHGPSPPAASERCIWWRESWGWPKPSTAACNC